MQVAAGVDTSNADMLADEIAKFVRQDLLPAENWVEEHDEIPDEIVAKMADFGLFGMTIPEAYGGLGLSMYEEARVVYELGYASPVFRAYFGTSNGVGTLGIRNDGLEEQKRRYLPKIANGSMVASFCLTEPDAGSDAGNLTTSARRDGNGYVINGTKRFICNSPKAGLFTVYARTGSRDEKAHGVSAFLVERDTPGVSVGKPYSKMGYRGSHTADVVFEDVRVPGDALLGGKEGVGFKTAMKSLDHARLHMASLAAGLCRRMIDEGVRYTSERKQFGQPVNSFQLIQGLLAECEVEAVAARAIIEQAALAMDSGRRVSKDAAVAKYFCTEAAGRIADKVLQMHGAYGYIKEYPIERLYRDVRLLRIYEGTSQILQLVIAKHMIKDAA